SKHNVKSGWKTRMIVMHDTVPERSLWRIKLRAGRLAWTLLVFRLVRRTDSRRRFDHAVDNSGDSFGLVAGWVADARRWRTYSPAAGGGGNNPGHQPRNRTACRLSPKKSVLSVAKSTADNTDLSIRLKVI